MRSLLCLKRVFCFILILMLQFVAMTYMKPDLTSGDPGLSMMRLIVIQQLTMIACPAVFMGVLLTTSLRATFRLRMPSLTAMALGVWSCCCCSSPECGTQSVSG
jgi:sodium transport system permease protein